MHVMKRHVSALFAALVLGAVGGGAREAAPNRPAGRAVAAPRPGGNFTIPDPALTMIWIAPGTFQMRSTHGAGDDTQVTLTRGYWLGRTEVTQAQWQAVNERVPVPSYFKGSDRPVEQVGWNLASEFCQRLTDRERAAGRLPAGYAYALPTEAQWEYACRAGTTGIYAGDPATVAWYDANSGGQTHPVAQRPPNAWGIFDMLGNVQEWCADWYKSYPGGRAEDPAGPAIGQFHVVRGGNWANGAGTCRSGFRHWVSTGAGSRYTGFRVALAAQDVARPRRE